MEIKQIDVNILRHAEYNPRQITEKQFNDLKRSIERFEVVQPLVVNCAAGRENVVIGGNQRLEVLKKMGHATVPCVLVHIPDLKNEQELNIRLNRGASWDFDKLANEFDVNDLRDWGFSSWELGLGEDENQDEECVGQSYTVSLEFSNKAEQEAFFDEMTTKGMNCRKRTKKVKPKDEQPAV